MYQLCEECKLEFKEYEQKVKDLYRSMAVMPCNECKLYKKIAQNSSAKR